MFVVGAKHFADIKFECHLISWTSPLRVTANKVAEGLIYD